MRGSASTLAAPVRHRPADPSGNGPTPPLSDRDGGGTGWVELTRTRNDIEAHLLTGRLNEAGVETSCLKDRGAPGAWLHGGSNPWAPVTVFVKKVQLDDARLVLAEISWSQAPVDPMERPTIERVGGTRYALTWWVAAIALGLLFTSIALARTGEVLHSCDLPLVCGSGAPEPSGE